MQSVFTYRVSSSPSVADMLEEEFQDTDLNQARELAEHLSRQNRIPFYIIASAVVEEIDLSKGEWGG